ncbi:ethylene-responsive transcription factor ERF119-like [Solanum pennellii]|uniref:Ethylene-responsive transcription factor ERF119-like n=1 Tax=Solanum pennellii TaxID=28526 RepID=A0ABM1GSI2_SOLPN|nr:ethylene-responsive transcription factor ERF119-like [Solanum pennellii]
MKSKKKISTNFSVRLYPVGVRKRKNGKFCAEIKHPFNKKLIWLGTFVTADEAYESYKSKKVEFEELVMAKEAKKRQKNGNFDRECGSSDEYEEKSLMGIAENSNSSNGVEENIDFFAEEKQKSLMGIAENSNSSNGVEGKINFFAEEKHESLMGDSENLNLNSISSNGEESDEELFKGTWVKNSEGKEVMFSYNLGVPIIDNYGFLLGEFSDLDDLTFM